MKRIPASEYYNLSSEQKKEYCEARKKELEQSDDPVFKKMHEIKERIVRHYEADFYVHDLNLLTIERPQWGNRFAWFVRRNGTHMVPLDHFFKEDKERSEEMFKMYEDYDVNKGDAEMFLIDLNRETVTPLQTADSDTLSFSYTSNGRASYFESLEHSHNPSIRESFKQLMHDYGNYPPKSHIDALFQEQASSK
ncbi:hypothetical protein IMZ31_23465 (plasmid) [Pontibacillus sp. ALD_SL1]|uniref:hypothetical protein n=1 Tax=Pontibacillus sp. ALD_SL1 TaxID=2777185 RepID=UPI001A96462C|nr:hypothetical protein [Pontibacillus sp. ALD_SL1]QST02412.1 hypothetical protein IMZ31_23465 [Pontibacillus sp. ALD_SL1]